MTITNDERREVAENLRAITMHRCRYKEEFYDLLNEIVMNEWGFYSFNDVADRLADLIEPEPERTCRMEYDNEKRCVFCSSCGEEINVYTCEWCKPMEYSYLFCYQCGAKVVE